MKKHGGINLIKKTLIIILYIIIIPIMLYDLYLIVHSFINPDITPSVFGYKTFTIISGSMEPTINIDDIIITKNINSSNDIKIDDIITFKTNNEIVTHRVIEIEKKGDNTVYTTKGDKNEVTDIVKIEYDQIEGKYFRKIPLLGKVLSILKNKVIFESIIVFLVLCFLWQNKMVKRKVERSKKRKRYENSRKEVTL